MERVVPAQSVRSEVSGLLGQIGAIDVVVTIVMEAVVVVMIVTEGVAVAVVVDEMTVVEAGVSAAEVGSVVSSWTPSLSSSRLTVPPKSS
jgi:hypothetical protein